MKYEIWGCVWNEAAKKWEYRRVCDDLFNSRSTAQRRIKNNDANWKYDVIMNAWVQEA